MKTNLFQKVMALICAAILLVSFFPSGGAQAAEKPGTPSITVKAVNDTDVKVTIGKTSGADGYEVWITSDCGYMGYKNTNSYYYYDYGANDQNTSNYINAACIEKNGSAERSITLTNLSVGSVSVKVRAYIKGSGPSSDWNYNTYGDFSSVNTVKVTAQTKGYESSYNFSKVKKGATIKFGTYEQDYPVNGKDPIEWVVLDKTKNEILVMSKYALDCLPYNVEGTDVTWETSTLREWLNVKFYNIAFNKTEKAMIRKTGVKNKSNPDYGTDGGNDTKDKVFLLSIDDIVKEKYGFNPDKTIEDNRRGCKATKYMEAQGGVETWWLRSPAINKTKTVRVYGNGTIDTNGESVDKNFIGVRPAMWIKLKSK